METGLKIRGQLSHSSMNYTVIFNTTHVEVKEWMQTASSFPALKSSMVNELTEQINYEEIKKTLFDIAS